MGIDHNRAMRVLHVAQPLDAGVPRVAGDLVADQVRRGWDVSVACPQDSELHASAGVAGACHLRWEATRAPGTSVPGEARRLAVLVREADPELVHLHSAKAGLAGRMAIRGRRTTLFQPHAWSFEAVRGPLRSATVAWDRVAPRWTSATVCVSEDERRRGESVGVGGRFAVVPNGVDLSRWPPAGPADRAAARQELGLDDGPLVLCVGRLSEQKGQDVLLEAWRLVAESAPAAGLALVGEGPSRALLESAAPARVRFAGKRDDVGVWLAAADVVAIPSRWEAGLPLVAMEAMARGRSVVAADVAGVREGLQGGGGRVVPIEAAQPLAEALTDRLLDPALLSREGAAGRRRVEERYDLGRTTALMAELYESVIADR
jgi:glycosyltransferase involved in cell wall biosynthesis